MVREGRYSMTITRAAILTAVVALVTCIIAGCSAPPAPTVPGLVTKINAICTSYGEQVEALAAPTFAPTSTTAADLGAVARYLDRAVPLLQSERSSIEAAGTPRTDTSLYDSMLAALTAHVHDEQAAQAAAHAGDLRSFQAALHADQADSTHLSGTAQQFGVTACLSD
jgi:hypothetical protein